MALGLTRRWRAERRTRHMRIEEAQRLALETEHARLASELSNQTSADRLGNWRVLEVVEVCDESADCRSFYLQDPLGNALPAFDAGQFVLVRPALGGHQRPARCYSLSDSPSSPWYRITVKRIEPTTKAAKTHSPGLSAWLHENIQVGDCLLVSKPTGDFILPGEVTSPLIMLAAGIGVTPIISMVKHALQSQVDAPIEVFLQVTDSDHWPFGSTLHRWSEECPQLNVHSYFSRTDELPHVEAGVVRSGKVNANDILERVAVPASGTYFMCGPESWMQGWSEQLEALGVPDERIHRESFGALTTSMESGTVPAWSLEFENSGLTVEPNNKSQTIWSAAKEHGLELPAACHGGACGSCRLKLKSGVVRYARKPACALGENEVLTCIGQAEGRVVSKRDSRLLQWSARPRDLQ